MNYSIKEVGGKVLGLENKVDSLSWQMNVIIIFLVSLVITLIFTLGGFVMDYLSQKHATYQNLTNQVTESSAKIDLLYQQCNKEPVSVNITTEKAK